MARLFGTDGIRGVANAELTGELAFRLGRACVLALTDLGQSRPEIVVGRDPRASGELLEGALAAGICSAGGDAVLLGVTTTPAVAFLTADLGAQAGASISASHNPAEDNGFKFFAATGWKLPDEVEDEIEAIVADDRGPRTTGRGVGRIRRVPHAGERYLGHLEATAEPGALQGLRLVVDCANGSASGVAPELLKRLGAEVLPINDEPNGWNINEACGATHPEALSLAVVEAEAHAGVAHDGDADRAIFADGEGRIVDGDHVLAACAVAMRDAGELTGDRVVTTPMANLGFHRAMRTAGIDVVEAKVGDRYVLEEMARTGSVLGGEQSGHIIFLRLASTGDGLLTAARFLNLATRSGRSVADLASVVTKFPQVLQSIEVRNRDALERATSVWDAVATAEAVLGLEGRVLVRASGTESVVRVMVEAPTEEAARGHADAIARAVRAALG